MIATMEVPSAFTDFQLLIVMYTFSLGFWLRLDLFTEYFLHVLFEGPQSELGLKWPGTLFKHVVMMIWSSHCILTMFGIHAQIFWLSFLCGFWGFNGWCASTKCPWAFAGTFEGNNVA
jgi:hypothetical protein